MTLFLSFYTPALLSSFYFEMDAFSLSKRGKAATPFSFKQLRASATVTQCQHKEGHLVTFCVSIGFWSGYTFVNLNEIF